jgi:hypothetical protein
LQSFTCKAVSRRTVVRGRSYFLFAERPDAATLAGVALIALAGLLVARPSGPVVAVAPAPEPGRVA